MGRRYFKIILLGVILATSYMGSLQAQLLADPSASEAIGASIEVRSLEKPRPDTAAVIAGLEKQGYTNIQMASPDARQFTANTPDGMPMRLTIEPITGQILSALPQ